MEAAVDQCFVDKNIFEIQIKQLRIDNDQLLNQIMSQEIVHIVANSVDILDVKKSCVNDCNKCLELETELFKKKDFIEKEAYNKFVKSYSNLEKHCISLELATQLNQEIFQRENSSENLNAPTFNQLFEINKLKAQSQEKDTVIRKLKERIKSLSGKDSVKNVKKDIDEIETINIELEHRMFKLDIEPISPRLKNNRDTHEFYIEKTIEYSDTLHGFVERDRIYEELVAVTTINKDKRVRFAKPVTSLSNIPKPTDSLKTKYSNKPLLTSTGVKPTTSTSGSKPSGNTKNNRITRPPRINQKNKVEDYPRKVKSSLNKTNSVSKPISNALVKHSKSKSKSNKKRKAWKSTGKVFTDVGYKWKPTGRFFTIVGNSYPLARLTPKKIVHLKKTTPKSVETLKPEIKVYSMRPKQIKLVGCPDRHLVSGLQMFKTYDREPLSAHELRFRDTNLYTISLNDMLKISLIRLLSKALKIKSWLWHRRLSHLNFGTLNKLAKDDLARGIPKLKIQKDHLCSACALGKSKKSSHQPKAEDTNQEKLYLLHMDLCGPMRVESINGKKYILVIVDDYSRFTWVKFLRSKDEAPDAIIKCIKNIQVRLNATVRNVRTDNGTEFVNQTLRDFYENVSISHQTSVARTPQQNGVVERRNRTLMEAARTMLIFSKAPLFLWAEAINTACYTQNRSLIRLRYNKTPYELMHDNKPVIFYVFH
ncbi:retrovirus-related pol polyprotein from transposon TNT 1-94 [Tanacetum coccineum]